MLERHNLHHTSLQMLDSKLTDGDGAKGVPSVLKDDEDNIISFGLSKKSVCSRSFPSDRKELSDQNNNPKSIGMSNMKPAKCKRSRK